MNYACLSGIISWKIKCLTHLINLYKLTYLKFIKKLWPPDQFWRHETRMIHSEKKVYIWDSKVIVWLGDVKLDVPRVYHTAFAINAVRAICSGESRSEKNRTQSKVVFGELVDIILERLSEGCLNWAIIWNMRLSLPFPYTAISLKEGCFMSNKNSAFGEGSKFVIFVSPTK